MDHNQPVGDPSHVPPPDLDAAKYGRWEPVQFHFRHNPVHVALLHTGKVLAFGGSGNDETNLVPNDAELFDPVAGTITSIHQPLAGDVFCSGHAFLADGRLLVGGGTLAYDGEIFGLRPAPPFTGIEQAYTFDPATERWTRVGDMCSGRWYPSLIELGDGRVLAVAGLTKGFPWAFLRKVEVFDPSRGWSVVPSADRWMPLYPRLHLLPDGRVFYAGSYNTHYTFPFTLGAFPTAILEVNSGQWDELSLPAHAQREEGGSVLMPLVPPDYRAGVLLIGGGHPEGTEATASTEFIDLSSSTPAWQTIASMAHQRYYCYCVLLPDKTLMALGGRSGKTGHDHTGDMVMDAEGNPPHDPDAILECELLDLSAQNKAWTPLAPMTVDRLYHSNALLLPDGRVVTMGSNLARRCNELRIEIYEPPYLHRGPRPKVKAAPEAVIPSQVFEIGVTMASKINSVVLVKASSTTHCFNTDQRLVELTIMERATGVIKVQMPANPNVVPPGYYMLFVLANGVPSVARFVRAGAPTIAKSTVQTSLHEHDQMQMA